jgi:lipid-A-disaccharide synthase-like uncharacterized protein
MKETAKPQGFKVLSIALGLAIIVGATVAFAPTLIVIGMGVIVFSVRVFYWLRNRQEWLYGVLLGATALAPMFQIDGQATLVRDLVVLVGYSSAALLTVIFFIKVMNRPSRLKIILPIDFCLLCLLGWQFLSLFRAVNLRNTLVAAMANVLIVLSCVYGLRMLLQEKPEAGKSLLVFENFLGFFVAVTGMLLIVMGPVQIGPFYYGNYQLRSGLPYMTSVFDNPNTFGNLVYISLIATYALWRDACSRWLRLYLLISGVVMSGALFLSFARSAYLGLMVGVFVLFWKQTPLWFKLSMLVIVLLVGVWGYEMIRSNPDWAYALKLDSGLSGRDKIWSLYIDLLRDSPLVGKGSLHIYYNRGRLGGEIIREPITTHNAYLSIAVFCGYVGLFLFIGTQFTMIALAFMKQRSVKNCSLWISRGGLAIAIALSIQQLFVARLFPGMDFMHIAFWIALTMATIPYFHYQSSRVKVGLESSL